MKVSKSEIKIKLDNFPELKENMVYTEEWKDFKSTLADLISQYSSNTTPENKRLIDSLIDRNYADKSFIASRIIENLILELGINERNQDNRSKRGTVKKKLERVKINQNL